MAICAQPSIPDPLGGQIGDLEIITRQPPGSTDGKAWLKLAILYQDAARYREAESAYLAALSILKTGNPAVFAEALDRMGTLYLECGAFRKAERLEREALHIRKDQRDLSAEGISHAHLSALLFGKRKYRPAEAQAETAVTILMPEPSASPDDKMGALVNLSLAQCALGACAKAIHPVERALGVASASYGASSIPVGFLHFLLGYFYWKCGNNDAAAGWMRSGTLELSRQLSWGHPMYVQAVRQYAMFLAQTGHASEAQAIRAGISKFEPSTATIDVNSLRFSAASH